MLFRSNWGNPALQTMETAATAATSAGMIVFAASGDNDSSDGGPTPANVDAPASCPHVIGCGGTTKTAATEVVWNNNPGKTDGGHYVLLVVKKVRPTALTLEVKVWQ